MSASSQLKRGLALFRGGVQVGSGATVRRIVSGTVTVDPANLAANTKSGTNVTLTGASPGDVVLVVPPSNLEDDLIPAGAVVTANDTLTVYLYNGSGTAVDGASRVWSYLWFDLT